MDFILDKISKEEQTFEIVLKAVQKNGTELQFASDEFKKNKKVVIEAIKNKGRAIKFADSNLKRDSDVALAALNKNVDLLRYIDDELFMYRTFFESALDVYLRLENKNIDLCKKLKAYVNCFFDDKTILLKMIKIDISVLNIASNDLKSDKEFILNAVKINACALEYASNDLKSDKEFILNAVRINACALKYANIELKNDKEFILNAIEINCDAFQYAGNEIINDREVAIKAINIDVENILVAGDEIKNDYEIARYAVEKGFTDICDLGPDIRYNQDIAWLAFEKTNYFADPSCLPSEVLTDANFVIKCIEKNPDIYQEISDELKNNIKIASKAIRDKSYIYLLEYVGPELKNNRDFYLELINNVSAFAISYVGENLKEDNDLALESVKKDGRVLKALTETQKDNLLIVLTAIYAWLKNPEYENPFIYASDFIKEYIRTHDVGFDTHWQ